VLQRQNMHDRRRTHEEITQLSDDLMLVFENAEDILSTFEFILSATCS